MQDWHLLYARIKTLTYHIGRAASSLNGNTLTN